MSAHIKVLEHGSGAGGRDSQKGYPLHSYAHMCDTYKHMCTHTHTHNHPHVTHVHATQHKPCTQHVAHAHKDERIKVVSEQGIDDSLLVRS